MTWFPSGFTDEDTTFRVREAFLSEGEARTWGVVPGVGRDLTQLPCEGRDLVWDGAWRGRGRGLVVVWGGRGTWQGRVGSLVLTWLARRRDMKLPREREGEKQLVTSGPG